MKSKLRAQKLLERLSHHPQEKADKDFILNEKIAALPEFKAVKNVLFYWPMTGEVDLSQLFLDSLLNKKFILPRVQNKILDFYYIDNLNDLEVGSFKILEPKKHLQKAQISEIELALVPGIVFSENGHRIGYGKGFYDRFLKSAQCMKIGIAYDFQIVENIEGEIHDVAMDMIVTDKRLIRIKSAA